MNLNEALAALSKAPVGSFISRPNGPTVRMSRGTVEHAVHRYVVDLPEDQREYEGDSGVRAFDANADDDGDLWGAPKVDEKTGDPLPRALRNDWQLTKRGPQPAAKATLPPKEKRA